MYVSTLEKQDPATMSVTTKDDSSFLLSQDSLLINIPAWEIHQHLLLQDTSLLYQGNQCFVLYSLDSHPSLLSLVRHFICTGLGREDNLGTKSGSGVLQGSPGSLAWRWKPESFVSVFIQTRLSLVLSYSLDTTEQKTFYSNFCSKLYGTGRGGFSKGKAKQSS